MVPELNSTIFDRGPTSRRRRRISLSSFSPSENFRLITAFRLIEAEPPGAGGAGRAGRSEFQFSQFDRKLHAVSRQCSLADAKERKVTVKPRTKSERLEPMARLANFDCLIKPLVPLSFLTSPRGPAPRRRRRGRRLIALTFVGGGAEESFKGLTEDWNLEHDTSTLAEFLRLLQRAISLNHNR
ncbi:hypothetical protein EVAR_19355_1 [Eumeta japonica]|uniref:Uncharacterized protein n=1 Tax=Eumeta variegata TaxID=151549 RepID=A0A4C1TRF2_EUMVA|nr:hypothetical protein EVAR_19355_1 [Eumeta japonica]